MTVIRKVTTRTILVVKYTLTHSDNRNHKNSDDNNFSRVKQHLNIHSTDTENNDNTDGNNNTTGMITVDLAALIQNTHDRKADSRRDPALFAIVLQ